MKLSQANQRWHQNIDALYQTFLEELTALNLPAAGQHWAGFKDSLSAHIEFEERHIEPLAENLDDNIQKLIQSDHLILNRLMPRLDTAIEAITQSDEPRTELVRSLDGFIKMRNVLIHHDLREMEQLYSVLDQQLSKAEADKLSRAMDEIRLKLKR